MRLLVDTDVFCKLGVTGLFGDTLDALGIQADECGRLPALPHMLRRGTLPRVYGAEACAKLLPVADSIACIGSADADWLDRLTPVPDIDPGEAQLLATAAQQSLLVLSGDKRALRAVKGVAGYAEALSGRVIILEAVLTLLCDRIGVADVRRRIQPLMTIDTMAKVCFSEGNADPKFALASYLGKFAAEVTPMLFWTPPCKGAL